MDEVPLTLKEHHSVVNILEEPGVFYLVAEVRPDGYVQLVNPHDEDDRKIVGLGEIETVWNMVPANSP